MKKFDKKTQIKILKIILIIIWMTVVFGFSNQQGTASGNTSRRVTIVIAKILTGNKIDENSPFLETVETVIRKLAHFSIYTLGGFLIMNYAYSIEKDTGQIQNKEKKNDMRNKMLYSIAFGAGYAMTDEIHQFFVPDRSARLFDVGIDTLGVITGVIIYVGLRKCLSAIINKYR